MNKLVLIIAVVALTSLVMLPCGLGIGFFLGMSTSGFGENFFNQLNTFPQVVIEEEPADIDNPQDFEGERFRLKYPGNWTLVEDDAGSETGRSFSIHSLGGSYAKITVYDHETDPQQNVDEAAESVDFSSPDEHPLEVWGEFFGKGVLLLDIHSQYLSQVRIFSHSNETSSFLVIEHRDSTPSEATEPGFDLIAESFELIEPPTEEPE